MWLVCFFSITYSISNTINYTIIHFGYKQIWKRDILYSNFIRVRNVATVKRGRKKAGSSRKKFFRRIFGPKKNDRRIRNKIE